MYNNKKIVAIIPARGGSKRVPKKNIKSLCGNPLISYIIRASLASRYIDKTIVSTDDSEIAEVSRKYGAEVIDRPAELARDETPDTPVLRHVIKHLTEKENYTADIIVFLHATSPLCGTADIDNAIERFAGGDADLVAGVVEAERHPFWNFRMINGNKLLPFIENISYTIRQQELPKTYILNGAFYIMRAEKVQKESFFGGDMHGIIMSKEKSIDIDTELDFEIAEFLMKRNDKRKCK